jgi:hypothetical protein
MAMKKFFFLMFLPLTLFTDTTEIWKPTDYIWSYGFALDCNLPARNQSGLNWNPDTMYNDIIDGDIIWVPAGNTANFINSVFPKIEKNIIIILNCADESFPSYFQNRGIDIFSFIEDPRIIHIFAQNSDLGTSHAKVTTIPIGLDFHTLARDSWNAYDPSSFQLPKDQEALWKKKGEYAFSISPHGNGWDCQRTWEDLILGCIVIVKTSPLDCLYKDLPVVNVQDWSEVTSQNLEKWGSRFGNVLHNLSYREKLTHCYWMAKIKAKQAQYLSQE